MECWGLSQTEEAVPGLPRLAASALLHQVVAMGTQASYGQIILLFKRKGRNWNFCMQCPNFYYW